MDRDSKKIFQLENLAEKIAQVNISPQKVEQEVNISLFVEQLPPVPPRDIDEMDEVISNHRLEQIHSKIMDSSHELIIKLAEAKKLASQTSKKTFEEKFLFSLGLINFSIGKYEESINFYNQASLVQSFEDDFLRIVANMSCIGSSLLLNGEVKKALEKYQESIKIIEAQQGN